MPVRLIERLNAMRHRYFVGRESECERFQSTVESSTLPFSILYVYGLTGLGKTTLLWRFSQICQTAQIPVVYLDGRTIAPTPAAFLAAFQAAAPDHKGRCVLLIDSYEQLEPIANWLREQFLPDLPEQMLIVLASRHAPDLGWRADLGWKELLHAIPLSPLNSAESSYYLNQRSIPPAHHGKIISFTKGHPLAISLMADAYLRNDWVNAASKVRRTLLEMFLEEVPSPTHRVALEACALVPIMTEALLAEVLDIEDGQVLFDWLRGLSFMEVGETGLMLHEVVREAIAADLHWRNPDRWATLQQRAQTYASTHFAPKPMPQTEQPIVLSQAEFAEALRDAFRHFFRPEALQQNPLLRSRLVLQQSIPCDRAVRIAILRSRLQETAELLQASPRDEKLYWALYHTYLQPTLTQEQAADLLNLPFSTYRRYLKTGIARVAEMLWQQEVLSA